MLLEEIGSGRSDCGWKAARAEASLTAQIQMALDAWVSERATSEKMTGAAAYISFGEPGPAIEVFAEKVGAGPQDPPVRQNTLFQRIETRFKLIRNPPLIETSLTCFSERSIRS